MAPQIILSEIYFYFVGEWIVESFHKWFPKSFTGFAVKQWFKNVASFTNKPFVLLIKCQQSQSHAYSMQNSYNTQTYC